MVQCKTDNCNKKALYGFEGQSVIFCKTCCTDTNMINLKPQKRKLCICGKNPSFGLENDKRPTCCKKCKTDIMINLNSKNKLCKCNKVACFGLINDTKPSCCKDCSTNEMINIKDRKCKCGKVRPTFGLITDKKATCCKNCKSVDMVNIEDKKCICGNSQPTFGLITDKIATCCKKCRTDIMVDVKNKLCKCKKAQPNYGLRTDKIAICCKECRSDDMIDLNNKLCECGIRPNFGYEGKKPTCCAKCRVDDMIDLAHEKCKANEQDIICSQRGNKKYKGYCTHCFAHLFPLDPLTFQINCKTKENAVRDYINTIYEGFHHDKALWIDHCKCTHRRRIDHRKLIGNTLLCIETDENQHKYYDKQNEKIRYDDVMMIHGGKFIFIRFNPDKYKENNKTKNPTLATRLTALKEEIDKQINRIEKEENNELIEIIPMFYDK